MIVDRLENCARYEHLGSKIMTALRYLQTTDFSQLEPGEYPLDGRNIFAIVEDYNLSPASGAQLEAHRQYLDVQYLARGSENIGYAPAVGQPVAVEYDAEKDLAFFEGSSSLVRCDEGMFAVFFPEDLHLPGVGDPADSVRKVVVKVRI